MGRLLSLTCDTCTKAVDLPEESDLPDEWMSVSWQSRDAVFEACFCGWNCAVAFCSKMAMQFTVLGLDTKGVPS